MKCAGEVPLYFSPKHVFFEPQALINYIFTDEKRLEIRGQFLADVVRFRETFWPIFQLTAVGMSRTLHCMRDHDDCPDTTFIKT